MNRRTSLRFIGAGLLSLTLSKRADAAVPALVLWLWRIAGLFRTQAAALWRLWRFVGPTAGRRAVSASVLATRASRASSALRAVTATSIGAIATDEVLAHVEGTPEDSILRWMLAYYAVLTQSDSQAAMGMWSDPPDPRHFQHLDKVKPSYRLTRLEQHNASTARAWVVAQNPGEPSTQHTVDIGWTNTPHGYRISSFTSVA